MSRDIVPIMLGHAVTHKLFFTKTFDCDTQAVCKVFSYENIWHSTYSEITNFRQHYAIIYFREQKYSKYPR